MPKDQWTSPRPEHASADGRFVLTVASRWPERKPGEMALWRADGARRAAVWKRPLIDDCPPLHALVTRDGRRVALVDRYGALGHGKPVIVLGADGAVLRAYRLRELLDDDRIHRLRRSVSSIRWRGERAPELDAGEQTLVCRMDGRPPMVFRLSDGACTSEDLAAVRARSVAGLRPLPPPPAPKDTSPNALALALKRWGHPDHPRIVVSREAVGLWIASARPPAVRAATRAAWRGRNPAFVPIELAAAAAGFRESGARRFLDERVAGGSDYERLRSLECLAALGARDAVPLLRRPAAEDSDPAVQEMAERALLTLGGAR